MSCNLNLKSSNSSKYSKKYTINNIENNSNPTYNINSESDTEEEQVESIIDTSQYKSNINMYSANNFEDYNDDNIYSKYNYLNNNLTIENKKLKDIITNLEYQLDKYKKYKLKYEKISLKECEINNKYVILKEKYNTIKFKYDSKVTQNNDNKISNSNYDINYDNFKKDFEKIISIKNKTIEELEHELKNLEHVKKENKLLKEKLLSTPKTDTKNNKNTTINDPVIKELKSKIIYLQEKIESKDNDTLSNIVNGIRNNKPGSNMSINSDNNSILSKKYKKAKRIINKNEKNFNILKSKYDELFINYSILENKLTNKDAIIEEKNTIINNLNKDFEMVIENNDNNEKDNKIYELEDEVSALKSKINTLKTEINNIKISNTEKEKIIEKKNAELNNINNKFKDNSKNVERDLEVSKILEDNKLLQEDVIELSEKVEQYERNEGILKENIERLKEQLLTIRDKYIYIKNSINEEKEIRVKSKAEVKSLTKLFEDKFMQFEEYQFKYIELLKKVNEMEDNN